MVMLVEYKGRNGGQGFDVDIDVTSLPSRREAVEELSRPAAGAHARAKRVPPEMIAQALNNEPFEDYPRAIYACKRACDQGVEARNRFNQSYRQAAEGFLRRTFHSLTFIPEISFDVENVSEQNERKVLDATKVKFQYEAQLRGQVRSLEDTYCGLRALRTVFANAAQKDSFNIETVVPSRYLPELLMAAPVWFVTSKRGGSVGDFDTRYFCDLGASDQFAYLFQLYNRELRSIDEFQGRDVMPLPILQLVSQVRQLFDYLVIATPYHDLASREWLEGPDERWRRNIDPFLFGFLRQIPDLMFFLGRWSGTGLFQLVGDMIADTIQHMKNNRELLAKFQYSRQEPWYREDDDNVEEWRRVIRMIGGPRLRPIKDYKPQIGRFKPKSVSADEKWKRENHTLVRFAGYVVRQFERGKLFSWLRGESQLGRSWPIFRLGTFDQR
jgi:hypothetical protein